MKKEVFNLHIKQRRINTLFISSALLLLLLASCKKQLDVKNPNDPTLETTATSESGITALAKGVIYWNGFNYGDTWLGDSYFSLPWGYHELMGDVIGGGQGSNNQTTTMGVPQKFQADPNDPSTVFENPSPQVDIIRTFNTSAASANDNNALKYEWVNMYAMINGCNLVLENLEKVPMSADRANTIRAWTYWWKAYAFAQIGTLYYAGLIVEHSNVASNEVNNKYVDHATMIAESNKYLNLAITTLEGITSESDYSSVIANLIPKQNQAGLGLPPSSAQWIRTMNTMLARNIVLNHLSPFVNGNPNATINKASIPPMTATDWQAVIDYCNKGLQEGDYVFTGRTSESNSFFSPKGGSVAGLLTESNQTTTYKLSERLIQNFKPGDKRRANFTTGEGTFYGDANTNTTRWTLVDAVDASLSGITTLGTRTIGELEIYIGPTYEENALMLAEANIRLGNIETGLGYIDQVRNYQGAGIAAVKGAGLALPQALNELTSERLAALALRGLSFYDLRRWGWTYSIANGGGRYGATIIYDTKLYNNATIDYNFMDYWDVTADETDKNSPSSDSAPVKNPNY